MALNIAFGPAVQTANQFSEIIEKTSQDDIAAGTTQTQAGATILTVDLNRVTGVVVNGDGVRLPSAREGMEILILNGHIVRNIQIWPGIGDRIDNNTTDSVDPNLLTSGVTRRYVVFAGTAEWKSL